MFRRAELTTELLKILREIIKQKNLRRAHLAVGLRMGSDDLHMKLKGAIPFTLAEFIDLADMLGYEVELIKKD